MQKFEIEQAAKEHSTYYLVDPSLQVDDNKNKQIDQSKRKSFIAGATFVNERQPYTAEDIDIFLVWANKKWEYNSLLKMWLWCLPKEATSKQLSTIDLIKLWEESKNG
jgi:hypothetical protein